MFFFVKRKRNSLGCKRPCLLLYSGRSVHFSSAPLVLHSRGLGACLTMELSSQLCSRDLSLLPLKLLIFALLAVSIYARGAHGQTDLAMPLAARRPMFVFGSSYVDTGNVNNPDKVRPYPWSKPYGKTWPGSPSGRYSNGRVLTDVLAAALNLTLPMIVAERSTMSSDRMKDGINFAEGGSGVLSAYGFTSISSQIDAFQSMASSYTPEELASAVVLYATAGDDYLYSLLVQNTPLTDVYPLTVNVGKQIAADLARMYQLGLRKFAVTYLPPTGCLPMATTVSSFKQCNDSWSFNVAQPHNARLLKNVIGLRQYFTNGTIVLLDLYSAFTVAQYSLGNLKPCCLGTISSAKCSTLDPSGHPAYDLCSNPSAHFYWDDLIHPTEAGWQAVLKRLSPSLGPLLK